MNRRIPGTRATGLCLLAVGGCTHPGAVRQLDLGAVEPGDLLRSTIEVANPFDSPALISGIDGACGVRVLNAKNGVLRAGERLSLDLLSRAQRLPGPGAFKLDIEVAAGKGKKSATYLFSYLVRAHPFLDRSQLWLLPGTPSEIHVFGCDAGARISGRPPAGVRCDVSGRSITFRGVPTPAQGQAVATVNIGGQAGPLTIGLFRGLDPALPRVYPSSIWLSRASEVVEIVNGTPGLSAQATPAAELSATITGARLRVARHSVRSLSGQIRLIDGTGTTVATCTVGGPAMELPS